MRVLRAAHTCTNFQSECPPPIECINPNNSDLLIYPMDESRTVGMPISFMSHGLNLSSIGHPNSTTHKGPGTVATVVRLPRHVMSRLQCLMFTVAEAIRRLMIISITTRCKIFWGTRNVHKNKNIYKKNPTNLWKAWQNNVFSNGLWIARNYSVTKAAWKWIPNSWGYKSKWAFISWLRLTQGSLSNFSEENMTITFKKENKFKEKKTTLKKLTCHVHFAPVWSGNRVKENMVFRQRNKEIVFYIANGLLK